LLSLINKIPEIFPRIDKGTKPSIPDHTKN
jgi:hypothetical protein